MADDCLEDCAPSESYTYFLPDKKIPLDMLPNLTQKEFQELSGKAKGEWILFRQDKIIESMLGEDGYYERYHLNHSRSRRLSKNLKIQDLLPGTEERVTACKDWKERESVGK